MAGHTGSWIQVGGGVRGAGGLTHQCGGVAPPSQQLREGDLGGREPTGRRGEQEHAHNAVCSHACGVTEVSQGPVKGSGQGHEVAVWSRGQCGITGLQRSERDWDRVTGSQWGLEVSVGSWGWREVTMGSGGHTHPSAPHSAL